MSPLVFAVVDAVLEAAVDDAVFADPEDVTDDQWMDGVLAISQHLGWWRSTWMGGGT